MLDEFKARLALEAVGYACGRKLFCSCGVTLDRADAVLITGPKGAAVSCGKCFDKGVEKVARKAKISFVEGISRMISNGMEIDDGRMLVKLSR